MNRTMLIVSVVLGTVALLLGGGSPAMAGDVSSVKVDAPTEVVEDSDYVDIQRLLQSGKVLMEKMEEAQDKQ